MEELDAHLPPAPLAASDRQPAGSRAGYLSPPRRSGGAAAAAGDGGPTMRPVASGSGVREGRERGGRVRG